MRIILGNKLFVPTQMVSDEVLRRFRVEWKEDIAEEVVDEEGYIVYDGNRPKLNRYTVPHVYQTYSQLHGADQSYIALPRGDRELIAEFLPQAVDIRSTAALGYPLNVAPHVVADPRWVDQSRCIAAWMKHGSGLLLGTTGSGKTLMGIGVACRLGLRTLVLSGRVAAEGVWAGDFRKHTDIEEWEQRLGRPLIGQYRPGKPTYDISIATIQTFNFEAGYQKLAARDQSAFGFVIVDEVNEVVTERYGRLMGLWNPLSWLGLTATLPRDDRRHHLALHHIGPVRAEGTADQMRPEVTFIHTGYMLPKYIRRPEKNYTANPHLWRWTKSFEHITKDPKRLKLVVDNIVADLSDGRITFVFSERNQYCRDIHEQLRIRGYRAEYIIASTPKWLREEFYEKMRNGQLQCIVAGKTMDAMVSINAIDCLHVTTPISKPKDMYQIYGRTRRPEDGKLIPIVRHYLDEGGAVGGAGDKIVGYCQNEGWHVETRQYIPNPGLMNFTPGTVGV